MTRQLCLPISELLLTCMTFAAGEDIKGHLVTKDLYISVFFSHDYSYGDHTFISYRYAP